MNFQEELKRELMALPTKKEQDKARKAEEVMHEFDRKKVTYLILIGN